MKINMHFRRFRPLFMGACLSLLAACATVPSNPSSQASAVSSLQAARSTRATVEQRVALYLQAASATAPLLGTGKEATSARETYNTAVAELTILLRSADQGALWTKPLLVSNGGHTYQLRYQPGSSQGVWAPDYFTSFVPASSVNEKLVKTRNVREGVGGTLVGVRKTDPLEKFSPRVGLAAAVTATVDFQGKTATLVLNDPVKRTTVTVSNRRLPLAADFSAPLCFYPNPNAKLIGLMEGLRPGKYPNREGIFLLQPYDPSRIPIFFVHGLASTPYIWRDPINQIQEDPILRDRFQAVVFSYPTGNPIAYSAEKFRQELSQFEKKYPMPKGFVIISHSMGGLVSQMQTTTLTRSDWEKYNKTKADILFEKAPPGSLVNRCIAFEANPQAKRVVFISTPHRGAEMADQNIGQLAIRLIKLPLTVTNAVTSTLGSQIGVITGRADKIPDGVSGLKPGNPMLHVLDREKVVPPCHSIIGNQGKPGPLAESSDGVVPYWSSHLNYAKSEKIVPGPHSCYDMPESTAELRRILHLHLKETR
jgi:hypothetical protein